MQHLCALSLGQWIQATEEGLARDDPWEGLVHYVTAAIEFSAGALGALAGTIEITDEMAEKFTRSDELTRALVERAHEAGVLRADATTVDISLLVEQLGKSSLVEQFEGQGRTDLAGAASNARHRVITIALDGLRACHGSLAGSPPDPDLLAQRW